MRYRHLGSDEPQQAGRGSSGRAPATQPPSTFKRAIDPGRKEAQTTHLPIVAITAAIALTAPKERIAHLRGAYLFGRLRGAHRRPRLHAGLLHAQLIIGAIAIAQAWHALIGIVAALAAIAIAVALALHALPAKIARLIAVAIVGGLALHALKLTGIAGDIIAPAVKVELALRAKMIAQLDAHLAKLTIIVGHAISARPLLGIA